jgi:hypothetical protein
MSAVSLSALADAVASLPDPRSKQGVSHPYHGMLVLILLGLIAQISYVSRIRRWAKKHWHTLREPFHFKRPTQARRETDDGVSLFHYQSCVLRGLSSPLDSWSLASGKLLALVEGSRLGRR